MKLRSKNKSLVALSACMVLPFSAAAMADEATPAPDTSKWVCKFCVISNGWFGDLDFGMIYVDDPTPKFADWRGLDDDWFVDLNGDSSYRNEQGYYFDFYGRRLGLSSRDLEMRGGKQGRYELRASYQEIPRYLGYGTTTPYAGVGTDALVLPEDWHVSQADESDFAPATLETKRKTLGAGLTFKIARIWSFDVDVERQTKKGTEAFGGGLFPFNGVAFPAPVDYTTDLFDMALKLTGDRGQLRLGFMGSEFDNGNSSVTYDNPFALGFGDGVAQNALEPSNEYAQFNLSGAWRFSRWFRVSGKVAAGEMKQNVAFLPYSLNPDFADLQLPRSSLDGKLETSMYNLSGRAWMKLADGLDLTVQYKADKRDNKTPTDVYTPVMLDVFESSPRSNRPYGYDRTRGTAELRFRPTYKLRMNAGFKRDTLERTYQEILESEEDTFWGEIQFTAWTWLDTRLKYESSARDTDEHIQQGNYDRAEHPLMRKFNMADRDRDRATIEFNLTPMERMSVNLSWYATEDDYTDSLIGLTDAEDSAINLDFSYLFGENTNLYLFVTQETIESNLAGAPRPTATPWNGWTEDEIMTWGLGISGRFTDKLTYGLDYVSSDADGDIRVDSGAGEDPFPTMNSKMTNLRVYLDYDLNDRWGLGLDAYREEYDSSDWHVDGLGPLDINGVMTMGDMSPEYDVYVVRMLATLRFQ